MLINLISRLNMGASNIEKLTPLFTTKFTKKSVTFASSTSHWCSCETSPLVPVWMRAKSVDHLDTFSIVHNVALGEIHLFDQEIHLGRRSCIKDMRRARDLSFDLEKFFKFRKVDEKLFHSTVIIWNFWFEITLKRVIFAGSGGAWPNFPGKWDNSSYSSDLFPDVFSFSLSHKINFDKKKCNRKK